MSYVLGLGYNIHDSSACLMKDGAIVAAVARERLSRIKHDGGMVAHFYEGLGGMNAASWDLSEAIQYCLNAAQIGIGDVDRIVESFLAMGDVDLDAYRPSFALQYPTEKTERIPHHLAHAYGAYYASGFEDALVIISDGNGNSLEELRALAGEDAKSVSAEPYASMDPKSLEKISIYSVRDGKFELLRKDFTNGSLGFAYHTITFHIFRDVMMSGKTMGLAPFGKPGFPDLMKSKNGEISYPYLTLVPDLSELPPVSAWPEDPSEWSPLMQHYADMAWKVQHDIEEVLIDIAKIYKERTGHKNIVMAGGVALNSVANKKILDQAKFERIFILPAAGDDGQSIGCAYFGTYHHLAKRPAASERPRLRSASAGMRYSDADIVAALNSDPRLRWRKLDEGDVLAAAVDRIVDGQILGWYEGGSEIGPRALGQRSIVADPRRPDMKATLNRRVKFREPFRPFAPVVPIENMREYFDLDCESPYMLLIAPVHPDKRSVIPAITHVDGTARVQTVTAQDNGRFYQLVKAFGERTGVPVIVNTSYNIKGEPIVETPLQAVECFLCSDMDALVMETYFVEKVDLNDDVLLSNAFRMNERVVLSLESRQTESGWEVLSATARFRENREHRVVMSGETYDLLRSLDGKRTLAEIADGLAEQWDVDEDEARDGALKTLRSLLGRNMLRFVNR
jgi:carbamoyltransferase